MQQIVQLGEPTPINSDAFGCYKEAEERENHWVQNIVRLRQEYRAAFEGCTKEANVLFLNA